METSGGMKESMFLFQVKKLDEKEMEG